MSNASLLGISGTIVNSVSNVDGTLTISPTTGAVIASINLGKANTWTIGQQINASSASNVPLTLQAAGSQTGSILENKNISGTVLSGFRGEGSLLIQTSSTVSALGTNYYSLSAKGDGTDKNIAFIVDRARSQTNSGQGVALLFKDNTSYVGMRMWANTFTQNLYDFEFYSQNGKTLTMPSSGGMFVYNPLVNTQDISCIKVPAQTIYPGAGANDPAGLYVFDAVTLAATSPNTLADSAQLLLNGAPTAGVNMTLTRRYNALARANTATDVLLGLRAHASQSANLTQWESSTPTIMSYFNAAAQLGIAASTTAHPSIRMPAGTAPTSPNSGDFWTDTTQKTFHTYQAGVKQALVGTVFTSTASATVANTTTETTIIGSGVGTLTLPANFFVAGKTVRVSVKGHIASTATPTLQVKAYLGSTAVVDTTAVTLSTITGTNSFMATFDITCRTTGGSGTVMSQGAAAYFTTASTPTGLGNPNTATTTIDTTAAQAVDVKVTWGTASSSNTITGTNVTVTVMN